MRDALRRHGAGKTPTGFPAALTGAPAARIRGRGLAARARPVSAPMHLVSHHALLLPDPPADGAAVPDFIQLLPAGTFRGRDGRGPYRVRDVARVIAASLHAAGGRLPVDENHQIDTALKAGAAAPARGWIVALEARDGALWGRVEWTPTGRQLVAERAYRGISPAFLHTKAGDVVSVLRASLTNDPNLPIATLHSKQEPDVDLMKLRSALGLAEDAEEAAILAAAEAARTAIATHAADLRRIADAAKAGTADADAIVTALAARGADDAGALRAEIVSLQAKVTTMETAARTARATEVVDAAIRDGKPIPKALRDHYIARHARAPEEVETELAALPSLHAGGIRTLPAEGGADGDPVAIAAAAVEHQRAQSAKGISISTAEAVMHVRQKGAAA